MAQSGNRQPLLQDQLADLKSRYSEALSRDEALDFAIEAAELHMKFLKLATNKRDKTELSKRCKSLLDEAERIKTSKTWAPEDDLLLGFNSFELVSDVPKPVSDTTNTTLIDQDARIVSSSVHPLPHSRSINTRTLYAPVSNRVLSKSEEIILLKASKINGCIFPATNKTLKASESRQDLNSLAYEDPVEMSMSADQLQLLEKWKRPFEALPPPSWPVEGLNDATGDSPKPIMKATRSVDLVQDAATDCSVVASLCAGIGRTERGFTDILSTVIHPFDVDKGHPSLSPSGKYIVRLNFNGCLRQVIIDDRLPVSRSTRVLHVVDRNNPTLLWPALLEKAYLKVRGGYDFPGSNSGTDLWVLTGWIPEQVFLQHEETNAEKLWARMMTAFGYGDVLITMGTGAMTTESEEALGLVGEHDYAVIDIDDSFGQKRMLLKNPWLKATAWKSYHIRSTDAGFTTKSLHSNKHDNTSAQLPSNFLASKTAEIPSRIAHKTSRNPGTFWMDMNDVMQNFESIYLNWNPGLFKYRQDIHFSWNLTEGPESERSCPGSFLNNPQFAIKSNKRENVWLLLSKHFTSKSDTAITGESQGYISLYAFFSHGNRVLVSKGAVEQGPYVDSPQTLLTLDTDPNDPYTIVISEQHLPTSSHTFTLSTFSQHQVSLSMATPRFPQQASIKSSWSFGSAGGNAESERYSHNPQFSLTIKEQSVLSVTLETLTPSLNVHAKLLYGQGQRVYSVTSRDIVVDSGDYRRGCAIVETEGSLPAGTYTIICSTFDADQFGEFTLRVAGYTKPSLALIAKEGAGRIRYRLADASFGAGARVLAAPMSPLRLAAVNFTAKIVPSPDRQNQGMVAAHSPIRLTVELGRGPTRKILIASGDGMYSDSASGIRTEDVDLRPNMTLRRDMWLMLERLGGFHGVGKPEERVTIDMWADTTEAVEVGVWREWER